MEILFSQDITLDELRLMPNYITKGLYLIYLVNII